MASGHEFCFTKSFHRISAQGLVERLTRFPAPRYKPKDKAKIMDIKFQDLDEILSQLFDHGKHIHTIDDVQASNKNGQNLSQIPI
jgi:hypothetical protein